ncbi:MAG: hypothetical protein RL481_419 [Pseudomonadota bacterium]|jgi:hypothetical protein
MRQLYYVHMTVSTNFDDTRPDDERRDEKPMAADEARIAPMRLRRTTTNVVGTGILD